MWQTLKPPLIILGWAASDAAVVLAAIFHGLLLPQYHGTLDTYSTTIAAYLGLLGIAVLAALVIGDFATTIVSFFASYLLAMAMTYLVLVLPGYTGALPSPEVIISAAVVFTFDAFFPIPLLIEFVGSLVGLGLSERLM
ncbi:MAG: hypothetical protein AUJ07_12635 [Crenarchaeota archaeon 13_1_40CM_3_53_5]|nr:MAG: hypothetical protein AUJ07_12635 [Crenarchaeota archaeon 13_1_40CM_3_53_5]